MPVTTRDLHFTWEVGHDSTVGTNNQELYRSIYAIGEPIHVKYPIGVPAILAGLWMVLNDLNAVHQAALWLSLAAASAAAAPRCR